MKPERVASSEIVPGFEVGLSRWRRESLCPHDTQAIDMWIQRNTTGRYGWKIIDLAMLPDADLHSQQLAVRFSELTDAMAFKLRWC